MYVCVCNGVTEADIRAAAVAGCASVSELTMRTGCGANCGSCVEMARDLLAEHGAGAASPGGGTLVALPLVARAA